MKEVGNERRFGLNALVRLFHTGLCTAILTTLLWKETGLRWALIEMNDLVYGAVFLCLFVTSLTLYYIACLTDPGYVSIRQYKHNSGQVNLDFDADAEMPEDEPESTGTECSIPLTDLNQPLDKKNRYKYRFCDYCEIQPPLRSKHCEDCKNCIRKYDHHCPWLETCVGERNHRYFWWFLFTTAVLILWTFVIIWESFITENTWADWFHTNLVLFLDTVVLVISGPVVVGLLVFHTYLMAYGLTTWEVASRERITYLKYLDDEYNPFDQGCCKNIYYFMCIRKVQKWETLYAKRAKFKDSDV
ncbi:palmitoyltransferase ZDHHC12-B-like [Mercenaria mercenaria]|uniref:palmitoyltransferase ZDHHC12-B-like n=1 Tax=Mercenaria mercenaria TaxID=6596 RepID=UPI00234E4068|nr:palmitoyltransferase ZDHHC12-B-like [Mercenaria mercenaria]